MNEYQIPETASSLEIAYTLANLLWLIAAAINTTLGLKDLYWLRKGRVRDERSKIGLQRFRNNSFRFYISFGAVVIGLWAMTLAQSVQPERQIAAWLTGWYFLILSFLGLIFEWWQYSDRLGMKTAFGRLAKLREVTRG